MFLKRSGREDLPVLKKSLEELKDYPIPFLVSLKICTLIKKPLSLMYFMCYQVYMPILFFINLSSLPYMLKELVLQRPNMNTVSSLQDPEGCLNSSTISFQEQKELL